MCTSSISSSDHLLTFAWYYPRATLTPYHIYAHTQTHTPPPHTTTIHSLKHTQITHLTGLLASSDAQSAGKGGNPEVRPYAKLYGMVGGTADDDIDDGIEDVGGEDAYALAVKVLGGYDYTKGSKSAPSPAKAATAPRINTKRASLKKPKEKKTEKKPKKDIKTSDYVEANAEYGWGGVEVEGDTPADVSDGSTSACYEGSTRPWARKLVLVNMQWSLQL